MGDYTKLIVNCAIEKRQDLEKLKSEIEEKVPRSTSAYHCGGEFLHIDNDWHQRTDISIIAQAKYGKGIDEFLDWLEPMVIQGSGVLDTWSFELTEYSTAPKMRSLRKENE